ncbi:MAG TPA: hypothetical protein DDW90_00540 [Cyanobacteria bacterium UBA9971]|nr:hypothetical protein [Cyanobacteria bacterium UBA9971]
MKKHHRTRWETTIKTTGAKSEMEKTELKTKHVYGAAAIAHCLKDVDFPITKNQLVRRYGNCVVEIEKGETMKLKEVLDYVQKGTFNSPVDIEKSLK